MKRIKITIEVNAGTGYETTTQDVVTAVNDDADASALVVACWGAGAWDPEFVEHVLEEVTTGEAPWPDVHCFGLTADGSPIHRMAGGRSRIPGYAQPVLWKAGSLGGDSAA